jgi:hypothetical protein
MGGPAAGRDRRRYLAGVQPPACTAGHGPLGAAVPPVAVLAGLEVLLLQVRRAANRQSAAAALPPAATPARGVQAHGHAAAIPQPYPPALPGPPTPEATDRTGADAATAAAEAPPALPLEVPEASSVEAAARRQARQLYDQQTVAGQRVTGAALGRAIGRSERYGRLLLAEFRSQDEAGSGNGDEAAQAGRTAANETHGRR